MTRIGAGWLKQDKNGEHYISAKVDDDLLPLVITPEKRLIIKPNKDKTKDNQPDYYLNIFTPKQQTNNDTEDENTDFPF